MHSISKEYPKAFAHRFYLALSPKLMNYSEQTSVIPIGNGDDLAYFDQEAAYALAPNLAIPNTEEHQSSEEFYEITIRELLNENLSLISCWSPTYLLKIDQILRDKWLYFGLKGNDFLWTDLWPNLALISCWTDASSGLFVKELKQKLGNVQIQGKGLMSTESICSIPYRSGFDPFLSYTSHFYEFEDENGNIHLAHQLEVGKSYSIIVTTNGGLYRYKSGDCVEVTAYYESVPTFKFIGRQGRVSDIAGEKLSEAQVNEAFFKMNLPAAFLAAEKDRYIICSNEDISMELCQKLDNTLRKNCYYDQSQEPWSTPANFFS